MRRQPDYIHISLMNPEPRRETVRDWLPAMIKDTCAFASLAVFFTGMLIYLL